jgi:flagellar protein FlaG
VDFLQKDNIMLNATLDVYDKIRVAAASPVKASGPLPFSGEAKAKVSAVEAKAPAPLIDDAALAKAVKMLNDHVAPALQSIEFSMDKETNRTIVKVVDTATQKVLRQIPNEEVIAISKTLGKLQGLMIRQTA